MKINLQYIRRVKCSYIVTTFLILVLAGCTKKVSEIQNPADDPNEENVINYLALGDSYTIGEGVDESLRWPIQLGSRLDSLAYNVESVRIIAQTGWTTTDLMKAIDAAEIDNYNLVSLLIGVNNQYQHQSFEKFKIEFDILLDTSISLAKDKGRVFVVSIPDYGVTPFGSSQSEVIGQELDQYNEYMSVRSDSEGIPFVDITEISRKLGDSDGALAADKLHPSGAQYSAWVSEILPIVIEILEN